MKLRLHYIVTRAVMDGIELGARKAFQHTDSPSFSTVVDHIEREIAKALDEVIDFGDPT